MSWNEKVRFVASRNLPRNVEIVSDDGLTVVSEADSDGRLKFRLRNRDTRAVHDLCFSPLMTDREFTHWFQNVADAVADDDASQA